MPFFGLKVPKHYSLLGYDKHLVHEASRGYVAPKLPRPLRTGAEVCTQTFLFLSLNILFLMIRDVSVIWSDKFQATLLCLPKQISLYSEYLSAALYSTIIVFFSWSHLHCKFYAYSTWHVFKTGWEYQDCCARGGNRGSPHRSCGSGRCHTGRGPRGVRREEDPASGGTDTTKGSVPTNRISVPPYICKSME